MIQLKVWKVFNVAIIGQEPTINKLSQPELGSDEMSASGESGWLQNGLDKPVWNRNGQADMVGKWVGRAENVKMG